MALQPGLNTIQVDVNDWRSEKSEHLAQDESADNRDSQGAAKFRSHTVAQRKRKRAEQRRHGGHHDGTEAQQASLINSVESGLAFQALGLDRQIAHQHPLFLTDTNHQADPNNP